MLKKLLILTFCVLTTSTVVATESEEMLQLRNTTAKLLKLLVEEGVISPEKAEEMVRDAQKEASEQAIEQKARQMEGQSSDEIKVPYVPEFVKDQIRQEVRMGLREDVSGDLLGQAKTERWGMPGVTPEWVDRISLSGDIRLRAQSDIFAEGNSDTVYFDYQEANEGSGLSADVLMNTTENRERLRARVRLGVKAKISNDMTAKIRVASGSSGDPVSTNQTLGNYGNKYSLLIDRASLTYTDIDLNDYPWLTLYGGRMSNPFLSTSLLWDSDLAFEGVAATYRYNLSGSNDLFDMDNRNRTLYFTAGAFPIDEVELSSDDKWLFGVQLGSKFIFERTGSSLEFGLSYYDFYNITGERNASGSSLLDYSAPDFLQKGNTLFQIANNGDPSASPFGLASDFNELNFTARMTFTHFAPTHVVITADWVRNIGYDIDEINERTGGAVHLNGGGETTTAGLSEDVEGYQLEVSVGWPVIRERRAWRIFGAYRYLERDAVVDAFTDSDFHLGGTNAKGFILGGEYCLIEDTKLSLRFLSADEIHGAPLGIDVLQVDLISVF